MIRPIVMYGTETWTLTTKHENTLNTFERHDVEAVFDEIYKNEPVNAREISLSMFDIEKAIQQLKVKGSAGPDNLAPIVMKKCIDCMV